MGPIGTRNKRPLPCDNFHANVDSLRADMYVTGGDITFTWTYRVKDGAGRAAGEQLAGNAIGAGTPTREGFFRIEIFDGGGEGTLVRTIDVDSDTCEATYDNADLVSDFVSEPAELTAYLTNVNGSLQSMSRELVITKE